MNKTVDAIVCKQLHKVYSDVGEKITVLSGVDLQVKQGEMLAVIGASGSGKSTLLQLLGGLDQPTGGDILVAGQNIAALKEVAKGRLRNRYLGFVYQFHHLLPEFNAVENIALPLLIQGCSAKKAQARAETFMQKVGLKDRLKHRVGELSGGERQRVAIARALVTDPKCVLADEPTGNLDNHTAQQIFALMLELNQEFNTSFVIVTHNEQLAQRLNRVLTLADGKLHQAYEKN